MKTRAIVLVTTLLVISGAVPGGPSAAGARNPPDGASAGELSLELAFTAKSLPYADKPALSPDGGFIVFGVFTPKMKSPGMEVEPRYLPSGTPANFSGARLFIKELRSGRTVPLLPGNANSWRPVVSPDGRRVAFFSDASGSPQLWLHDVASGKSRPIGAEKIKPKLWPGDEACWSPDGKELFVPLNPAKPAPKPAAPEKASKATPPAGPQVAVFTTGKEAPEKPAGEAPSGNSLNAFLIEENNVALAAVRVADGRTRIIAPADAKPRPAAMRLSPSGAWVCYEGVFYLKDPTSTASFFDLAVVPAAGGPSVIVARELRVSEAEYFGAAYAWRPGRDQLVFLKDKKLWFLDLESGSREARQLAPELADVAAFPLDFTPDGSTVVAGTKAVDDHDYTDPRPTELVAVPVDGGPVKAASLEAKWTFRGLVPAGPRKLWAPAAGACALYVEDAETGEHAVLRLEMGTGVTRILWKGSARIGFLGATSDASAVLATYEDARTPSDLYLFSSDLASKKRLTTLEPRYEAVKVGPVRAFETVIPSYDGRLTKARTAIFLPPSYQPGDKCPTVVFHYGGSRTSTYADRFGGGSPNAIPALVFISRGYAVLLPDLIIGPEGEGRNPAQDLVDMLLPQVYHAVDLGYCDVHRLALAGQSYGGYGTAAIISGTNLFRAAVALDGTYDLAGSYSWMSRSGTMVARLWSEKGQGRMGTHPWGDLKRYIDNSPYYRADRINTPFLMLHGASDQTCPVEESRKMFSALDRLGKTAHLAVYEGEGHVIWEWSFVNAVDGYQRSLDFLKKYLSAAEN